MNKLSISLSIVLTSLLLTIGQYSVASPENMLVKNAWIAEAPPVSKVMVAYMTISNTSDNEITIIRAESANYSSIEFHETKYEEGMASMFRHEKLVIPAKSSITLKRGGKHLMLFNPVKPLKAGDTVDIKFTLSNGDNYSVPVTVKKSQF